MATPAEPLPTVDALKSANLLQSVDHARTLLLSPVTSETKSLIETMLSTSVGARGFFISLLTDPAINLDSSEGAGGIGEEVKSLVKDAANEEVVSDLIIKNTVMPATMVVAYEREGKKEEAENSKITMERGKKLLEEVLEEGGQVEKKLKSMKRAMEKPEEVGEYSAFVKKWKYDDEQRKAACAAISGYC